MIRNIRCKWALTTFDLNLQDLRLVQMAPDAEPVWMTELEKEDSSQGCRSELHGHRTKAREAVERVIKELSIDGPVENLQKFTSFRTRPHVSRQTGKESQKWLTTDKFAGEDLQGLISVSEFPHSWGQNTVDEGVVIIGAHQDSYLTSVGADDDGSGSVTILEAYRALIVSDFRPIQHVEFHWYSAEQAVAKDYEIRGVNVIAMSQFDMTAWVKNNTKEEVGIIVDYVDSEVTDLNKQLVGAYLDIPYVETQCGYACSDHASWSKAGYRSSFTIESSFENSNKNIHSMNDRIDISPEFSFTHALEFSKLAVAFAIELGGWTKSE
ncbi:peptidase [Lactarius indigo]|nr:peptidase [Lactarius indigo]